jgi:choline dehydrogenase
MPVIYQRTSDADRFSPFDDPRHLVQWQTLGSGPLSSNLAECGGLFLNDAIQIHVTPTHYLTFPKEDSSAWMTIGANVTQPQSCGRLQLRSADPSEPPVITTNYLDQQQDLERSIQGVEYVRELANSEVFRDVISAELVPGAKRITREAIARSIERYSQTLYHPIGTCAAGNHPEDAVDHRFRLRNSSGLWVVDGSVFPGITVGNPNATIMSLAWMAAEEIAASQ